MPWRPAAGTCREPFHDPTTTLHNGHTLSVTGCGHDDHAEDAVPKSYMDQPLPAPARMPGTVANARRTRI